MDFNRHVGNDLIDALKKQDLWEKKLRDDCKKGDIFLAIRKDRISFYHKGGRLFEFDGKSFKTHVKYTLVIDAENEDAQKNYVYEDQLGKIPLIRNFVDGYDGVKKNCELYSGIEARGVSHLYQDSPCSRQGSIFALDIEVVLGDDKSQQDRIDILLYNNDDQTLRFVEAKHFSNKELWSTAKPPVVGQIKRYEEQIKVHEKDILDEYARYIDNLNQIFVTPLKHPAHVDPKVSLLIFGFDDDQKRGDRFNDLILDNSEYNGIPIYSKGGFSGLSADTIWKKAKIKT